MKTRIALLVVLAIVVFVWIQRGAPNPMATRLGASPAAVETVYKSERAWAIREISADINEMARQDNTRSAAPAVSESTLPWHPDLLVEYTTSQVAARRDVKFD